MSVTYFISATEQILNGSQVITCPACGIYRGIRLTTTGDGYPVTGSCPNDHIWDEHRMTGGDVKRIAIDLAEEGR